MKILLPLFLAAHLMATEVTSTETFTPSTPQQLHALSTSENHLIDSIISPLSGQPVLSQTDLIANGAEPIPITRTYVPPHIPSYLAESHNPRNETEAFIPYNYLTNHYKGWLIFPHHSLFFDSHANTVYLNTSNGSTLLFQLSSDTSTLLTPIHGISNCSGDTPSGRHDPRNIHLRQEGSHIIATFPDGSTCNYQKLRETRYCLVKETLPNGRHLRYSYTEFGFLTRIEALDPSESIVYSTLEVSGSSWERHWTMRSNTGLEASYNYERRKSEHTFIQVDKHWHHNHKQKFYRCFTYPPILTSASSPTYRDEKIDTSHAYLLENHHGQNKPTHLRYTCDGLPSYHVSQILHPNGETIHSLTYDPPIPGEKEGSTTHTQADGLKTTYHYNKALLLTSIKTYDPEGILRKESRYIWDDRHWLKTIEVDKDGTPHSRKSFEYDTYGNPTQEVLEGDLTGSGEWTSYTIEKRYTQDNRNLLLIESHENGKLVKYTYLPNSNLITSKTVTANGQPVSTERYDYDSSNNLIKKTTDESITTYILRNEAPFIHMPEWIIESHLASTQEKLLRKKHITYDAHGNIAQEEIFDADSNHAYTLYKTYNERGQLLSETDPHSNKAHYTYDTKGRRTQITNFSNRNTQHITYDPLGNPLTIRNSGDEGIQETTTYTYNTLGRQISKTTPEGTTFHYTHDPLSGKTTQEKCLNTPHLITSHFDPFGNEITATDANGNTTHTTYNLYGSPTTIHHPDDTQETLRYTPDGHLASHTKRNGLELTYIKDALGRTLEKIYDDQGSEYYAYHLHHLAQKVDLEGNDHTYTYDTAGRKVKEVFSEKLTNYTYDPLGHLATKTENLERITQYKRDLKGQLLEITQTGPDNSPLSNVAYTYDADGNQITRTRLIDNEAATETHLYDSQNRRIAYTNGNGHTWTTTYHPLKTIKTDPHGTTTHLIYDPLKRLIQKEQIDSNGTPLFKQEMTYDPHGNLLTQTAHGQTHTLTYDSNHQVTQENRAGLRTTTFTYHPSGNLATKLLPDNTLLTYTYDPLGHLTHLTSSCGQIDHTFTHNLLGHLLSATDNIQNLTITRTLDPFGNILQETLPNNIHITKTYDRFDRPTSLQIDHCGSIDYTYDALYLRQVTRQTPTNDTYTHTYNTYSLSGHLLKETPIGALDPIQHTYDLAGQKTSITHPQFTQTLTYDPLGNPTQIDNTPHTYDPLNQLLSEPNNTYTYDLLSNRTTHNTLPLTTDDLNQLIQTSDIQITYTPLGTPHQIKTPTETLTLTYDPLGNLLSATSPNRTIQYIYDPLGRRLTRNQEHFLYDNHEEIGTYPHTFRTQGHTTLAIQYDNQTYAALTDLQQNIRRLIHPQTLDIASTHDYTSFGQETHHNPSPNPYRHASKRIDPALNLLHFPARDYSPTLGRFLTPDPIGPLDHPNLYQYAHNNPNTHTDPTGHFAFAIPLLYLGAEIALPTLTAIAIPIVTGIATGVAAATFTHITHELNHHPTSYLQYPSTRPYSYDIPISDYRDEVFISEKRRKKKQHIDPNLSPDLSKNPNFEKKFHPKASNKGHYEYIDKKTGDIIRYDKADPTKFGHRAHDHYHRITRDAKGRQQYLDENRNPVQRQSDAAHLYPPEWRWK